MTIHRCGMDTAATKLSCNHQVIISRESPAENILRIASRGEIFRSRHMSSRIARGGSSNHATPSHHTPKTLQLPQDPSRALRAENHRIEWKSHNTSRITREKFDTINGDQNVHYRLPRRSPDQANSHSTKTLPQFIRHIQYFRPHPRRASINIMHKRRINQTLQC